MAWQYSLIASALLVAHRELPAVGWERRPAVREMDVRPLLCNLAELEVWLMKRQSIIRSEVRKLSCIAESNDNVPAAMVVASIGISICMCHPCSLASFDKH
jgi:hypothetical protein